MQLSLNPFVAFCCLLGACNCHAGDGNATWPQFRGLHGKATAVDQSIPLTFGPGLNELWVTDVPPGGSSPIVWEDRVFLTGANDSELTVLCIDTNDGQEVWRDAYQSSFSEDYFHSDCSPAAPTSCTDGTCVVSCFSTLGLVAHDFDGNELWTREFDDRSMQFGTASSPVIHDGRVYYLRDTAKRSELLCLDTQSGREVWVRERDSSRPSFSTPCVWQHEASTEIVVAGSGKLDAYDATTGDRIWTVSDLPAFVCPSPVTQGDRLVFGGWTTGHVGGADRIKSGFFEGETTLSDKELNDPDAFLARFDQDNSGFLSEDELPPSRYKGAFRFFDANGDGKMRVDEFRGFFEGSATSGRNVMVAVNAGGRGEITKTHVAWESTKHLPYVASPVIHDGRVYCVKQGGLLTSWDLSSGEMRRPKRLGVGGEYYATPVVVGNHLFVTAERGKILVMSLEQTLKVVAENDFHENILATPAIAKDRLYVRTKSQLHAIGNR